MGFLPDGPRGLPRGPHARLVILIIVIMVFAALERHGCNAAGTLSVLAASILITEEVCRQIDGPPQRG